MRTLIVYYSRTGTTRTAAKELADLLGADLAEIGCDRYQTGLASYLRAAYESLKGKLPEINMPKAVSEAYDLLIVGAPMWAGHSAPPVRAFLSRQKKLPKKVALFITRGGSSPKTAFAEMAALLPAAPVAKLALREKDVKEGTIAEALRAFAAEIGGDGVP